MFWTEHLSFFFAYLFKYSFSIIFNSLSLSSSPSLSLLWTKINQQSEQTIALSSQPNKPIATHNPHITTQP